MDGSFLSIPGTSYSHIKGTRRAVFEVVPLCAQNVQGQPQYTEQQQNAIVAGTGRQRAGGTEHKHLPVG